MKKFILSFMFLVFGLSFTDTNAFFRFGRNSQVEVDQEYGFYKDLINDTSYQSYLSYWFIRFNNNRLNMAVEIALERYSRRNDVLLETSVERLSMLIRMGLILRDTAGGKIDLEKGRGLFLREYDRYIERGEFQSNRHWVFISGLYKNQFDMICPDNRDVLELNGNILSEVFKVYLKYELKDSPERFENIVFDIENYDKDEIDLTKDIIAGRVIPAEKALKQVLIPTVKEFGPNVVEVFEPCDLPGITSEVHYFIKEVKRDKDLEILCGICYDENVSSDADVATCSRGHIICKTCLADSIRAGISEQNPDKFTCNGILEVDCNCEYTDDQLRKAGISEDTLKNVFKIRGEDLKRRIKDGSLELIENDLFTCPRCDFVGVVPGVYTWQAYQCESCGYKCCPKCLKDAHFGMSCEQAKLERLDDIRLFFNKAVSEAMLVPCSGCGIPIQKDEQCNKLHCTSCGAYTCHACGKNIGSDKDCNSRPYDHFKLENSNCSIFYKDPITKSALTGEAQRVFLLERAIEKSRDAVREWVNARLESDLSVMLDDRELDMDDTDLDRLISDFAEEVRKN